MWGSSAASSSAARRSIAERAQLELGPALLDKPGLVLLAVELQADRLARLDEEHLADVLVGLSPDQLRAPGLLDLARFELPAASPSRFGESTLTRATLRR